MNKKTPAPIHGTDVIFRKKRSRGCLQTMPCEEEELPKGEQWKKRPRSGINGELRIGVSLVTTRLPLSLSLSLSARIVPKTKNQQCTHLRCGIPVSVKNIHAAKIGGKSTRVNEYLYFFLHMSARKRICRILFCTVFQTFFQFCYLFLLL